MVCGSDWPFDQFTTAVGTGVFEVFCCTVVAKGTFETADSGLLAVGWQVDVATLAIWFQF